MKGAKRWEAASGQRLPAVARWISIALIILGLLVIVRALPVDQAISVLRGWVAQQGALGMVVFAVAYVVFALLFVPGSALTLTAGAVFGLWWGVAVVSVAPTSTSALGFLISRYFARDRVEKLSQKFRKFAAIDRAVAKGGWKIIAMLRLSPAIPYSASNFLYGLTAIRFWPYTIASWAFMLPGTFLYVYLGYIGTEGVAGQSRSMGQWVLLVVGLIATVVVTIYITKLARRALSEQAALGTPESKESPVAASEEQAPAGWNARTTILILAALLVVGAAGWLQANRQSLQNFFGSR